MGKEPGALNIVQSYLGLLGYIGIKFQYLESSIFQGIDERFGLLLFDIRKVLFDEAYFSS